MANHEVQSILLILKFLFRGQSAALGQAKVDKERAAIVGNYDVLGFDVVVQHGALVDSSKARLHLRPQLPVAGVSSIPVRPLQSRQSPLIMQLAVDTGILTGDSAYGGSDP